MRWQTVTMRVNAGIMSPNRRRNTAEEESAHVGVVLRVRSAKLWVGQGLAERRRFAWLITTSENAHDGTRKDSSKIVHPRHTIPRRTFYRIILIRDVHFTAWK